MHSKEHIKHHYKLLLDALEEIVRAATSTHLELPRSSSYDNATIGYTIPVSVYPVVEKLMTWWVEKIDRMIDSAQGDERLRSFLLSKRGVTFTEYKMLHDLTIEESQFHHYRLFSSLLIVDDIHRKAFLHHLPKDEEDDFAVYLDLICTRKVPITSFFLRTKAPLYFSKSALNKHLYLVSQSGAGKSEMLKILIYDLQRKSGLKRQHSIVVLDPHSDLSYDVLGFVLNRKTQKDRVVYINPTINKRLGLKEVYSPIINIFDIPNKEEDTIDAFSQEITNAMAEMIKKPTSADDAFSTNMDAVLKPCIATLLRMGDTDLRDLKRFMDDRNNADLVAIGQQSPDEEHRSFFRSGFSDKCYRVTKNAVFIKIQSLLNSPVFRRLTVGKSTVNLEWQLNNGGVVIFDFPKGKGRKSASDFGRMMVAYIQAIALRRQDTPKQFRKQTYFFIDEFHNYVGNSIEEIMAESRKFALSLILAHQVVGQGMSTSLMNIILSNSNLKIVGKNAKKSLETMGANIDIPITQLKKIPKYEFYVHNKDKNYPAILMKSPDFLVRKPDQYNQFYMSDDEKKNLMNYFIFESGYYKKIVQRPMGKDRSQSQHNPLLQRIPKEMKDDRMKESGPIEPAHDL